MTQEALLLMSLTVAFPAIAGLIRLRRIESMYYPFLIYLFVSLFNELLVGLFLKNASRDTRTLDWQLFNLFEAIILFLQFYAWRVFTRFKTLFVTIFILLVCGWIVENFVTSDVFKFNPVFLICYSFVLVLLSVQTVNHIVVNENRSPLHRNAMFIICVALVVYFIYNIFVFTLLAKGISRTNKILMAQVFEIRVYINAVTNILFGIAVLFIPEKISSKLFFEDAGKQQDF